MESLSSLPFTRGCEKNTEKKHFDPISILLINDAYQHIPPKQILGCLAKAYTNLASLSSSVSRLRTRLRKIGLPESYTQQLHLPSEAYRALRKRSRDRMLQRTDKMDIVVPEITPSVDTTDSDMCGSHRTRRVAVEWANTTFGIPRMFQCAYTILQRRTLPSWNGGPNAEAKPAHVYAALNLMTGLGPSELLDPYVSIRSGRDNTCTPHTGNFEAYWICIVPSQDESASKHSLANTCNDSPGNTSGTETKKPFDRPCLFVASRIVQAIHWMRRALNLIKTDKRSLSLTSEKIQTVKCRRYAWARRALLKTFGRAVIMDQSEDTFLNHEEKENSRNRNPGHRFTQAVYVATVAANYFEGFKVRDAAEYLKIQGDFDGLALPFTPLVNMLQKSTVVDDGK